MLSPDRCGQLFGTVGAIMYIRGKTHSFADVHDPASLRNLLFEWHARLVSNIGRFAPSTDAEVSDQLFMQSLVERIRVVIERAIEIESHRWQAIHSPAR